jgi:hypothetical protein
MLSPTFEEQRENNMRNLHGGDVVAGWTVAQWITVLRARGYQHRSQVTLRRRIFASNICRPAISPRPIVAKILKSN